MSRIKDKFQELKRKKQKALMAYVVAGYPSEKGTISAVRGLVKGGVDIIELGLPFSDPLADGPVIQNASYLALSRGMNLEKFLDHVCCPASNKINLFGRRVVRWRHQNMIAPFSVHCPIPRIQ